METPSRRCSHVARPARTAFTLIELVVVLGILMILLGFLLPALTRAKDAGTNTAQASRIRTLGLSVETYSADHDLRFPNPGETLKDFIKEWHPYLVTGGYLGERDLVTPETGRRDLTLSQCTVLDWNEMVPGNVGPMHPEFSRTRAHRATDVRSPTLKGLARYGWVSWGQGRGVYCCAPDAPRAPVVFHDISVETLRWTDMVPGGELIIENGIGSPVITTWYGLRGVDR